MKIYEILVEETFHILLVQAIHLLSAWILKNTPAFYELAEILN